MKPLIITLNILGWPLIQLTFARLFLLLPDALFAEDSWLTRERRFEQNGQLYRRFLLIQQWKGLLPDGASWLGGRSKRLTGRSFMSRATFAIETRRAEIAHWCMVLCAPVFYLWNPRWACLVMTLYGFAANLPCILVQRANRMKIERILHRSKRPQARQTHHPVESTSGVR